MHPRIDQAQYKKGLDFARDAHRGQRRKGSGLPYVIHPMRVASIVGARADATTVMVLAALLHDVVEDTNVELKTIIETFGDEVAQIVDELTNEYTKEKYPVLNRKARKERELLRIQGISRTAKIIKLADRLDNLIDSPGVNEVDDFNSVYADESLALAQAIGNVDPQLKRLVVDAATKLLKRPGAAKKPIVHYFGDGPKQFLTPCMLPPDKLDIASTIESTTCNDCVGAWFDYHDGPKDDAPEWCESNKKPIVWVDEKNRIVGSGPAVPEGYLPVSVVNATTKFLGEVDRAARPAGSAEAFYLPNTIAGAKTRAELVAAARLIGVPEEVLEKIPAETEWERVKGVIKIAETLASTTGRPVFTAAQSDLYAKMSDEELLTAKNRAIIEIHPFRTTKSPETRARALEAGRMEREVARRYVDKSRPDEAVVNFISAGSLFEEAQEKAAAHEAYQRALECEQSLPKPRRRLLALIDESLLRTKVK